VRARAGTRHPGGGRRPGRGTMWLAAAGVLALVAVVLTGRAAAERPSNDAVLVARAAVPAGTDLGRSDAAALVEMVPVPEGLPLAGLVRDAATAAGRPLVAPLSPGEPVTEAALGGAPGTGPLPLAPGERAISVPVSLAGVAAGALRPGVRVDLLASTGEGLTGRSRVVVANVEVLQAGDMAREDGGPVDASALLRVTARQALRVTEALDFARDVRLVIRPFVEAAP
jgi:pilus assembly protein CpaB